MKRTEPPATAGTKRLETVETDEPDAGAHEAPAESNVVRFPRDWFGPLDELVPFGPSAQRAPEPPPRPVDATPAEGEVVGFPVQGPVRPEDFWGERSAAIHHALEVPWAVEEPTRRRADPPRFRQISVPARVVLLRRHARAVALMLRAWVGLVPRLWAAIPRRIAPTLVAARRVVSASTPKRIAATPIVALTAGVVAATAMGFAITGPGGTSLERSSHSTPAAGALATGPGVIDAITQLERHVAPPAVAPAHEHPRPPADKPAPPAGSVAPTYAGAPNSSAVSAPAASSSSVVTHVATPAVPVTTTSRDRPSAAGGGGTSRHVAASGGRSSGASSESTSQPAAGPIGPGAPFGPGHLG